MGAESPVLIPVSVDNLKPVEYVAAPLPQITQPTPNVFYTENFVTPLDIARFRLERTRLSLRVSVCISLFFLAFAVFFIPENIGLLLTFLGINILGAISARSTCKLIILCHFFLSFAAAIFWGTLFFATFCFIIPTFLQWWSCASSLSIIRWMAVVEHLERAETDEESV